MLSLDVYNLAGDKVDTFAVDEAVFGDEVNRAVLRQAVLMYQANRRRGTASAKERGAIRATGKKPFRQKGTGRARQGTMVAPQHRGGAVAHGPRPRSYRQSMPRKARLAALRSAYLDRLRTATHVLDDLSLETPRTKSIADLLKKLQIRGTCLIGTLDSSDPVIKSVRNLPGVIIKRIHDINAMDLLWPRDFLVTRPALQSVVARFSGEEIEDVDDAEPAAEPEPPAAEPADEQAGDEQNNESEGDA
jgi:large subunit ribosomal protein L4